jgi:hypothetical protein
MFLCVFRNISMFAWFTLFEKVTFNRKMNFSNALPHLKNWRQLGSAKKIVCNFLKLGALPDSMRLFGKVFEGKTFPANRIE